jgi:hypothetical protein
MRTGILVFLALLLAGCGGRDFTRPESDSLRLGATTYDQVQQKYGAPRRTGSATRNGATLKTMSYGYATAVPFTTGMSVKGSGFYFLDNVLVGYEYLSSFKEDSTDFDETRVDQIREGQTTRAQVLELLGKPGGAFIYPMIEGKSDTALVYLYNGATRVPFVPGSVRITRKSLVVSIGGDGVVTRKIYSESKPN